jgi:ATP-dependent RNA helicase DDX52/ROK1
MEELFTMLSSSARLDKSKRKHKRRCQAAEEHTGSSSNGRRTTTTTPDEFSVQAVPSRDKTGKRDTSAAKRQHVHKEQMAAFRKSMAIKVADKHDPDLPDAVSSFDEIMAPSWWKHFQSREHNNDGDDDSDDTDHEALMAFTSIFKAIQHNIEAGRWKEPTPIQMQSIPTLLERRDIVAAAPTGSGKSGAFIIPALLLSGAPYHIYYNSMEVAATDTPNGKKKNKKKQQQDDRNHSKQGEIRSLLLAPSRELAAQLHREVDRLGTGKPGGISSLLLSRSNAAHVIAGTAGGKSGLDVLVTTPLRLVDALDKGLRLDSVRIVVLDEADRLLDAVDGKMNKKIRNQKSHGKKRSLADSDSDIDSASSSDEEEEGEESALVQSSGSHQTQTFLAQMDRILSAVPSSAVRGLFSATVTPTVKTLTESILRNPVDLTISSPGTSGGANTDIEQELMFVGREEGKLLAMRQLKQRGDLKPPVIVFVQSQERAQALFGELLYDGMHVDVIHAGRSRTARDNAVAKFRKGETWVLICTDLVARGVDFRAVNMVINYDLPTSGITYVHRIGRTGRAGRKGKAITLFTEADFVNLRTIANVMKQSGCKVEDWMLQLKRPKNKSAPAQRRARIDTVPVYDRKKQFHKRQMIQESKKKKRRTEKEEKGNKK